MEVLFSRVKVTWCNNIFCVRLLEYSCVYPSIISLQPWDMSLWHYDLGIVVDIPPEVMPHQPELLKGSWPPKPPWSQGDPLELVIQELFPRSEILVPRLSRHICVPLFLMVMVELQVLVIISPDSPPHTRPCPSNWSQIPHETSCNTSTATLSSYEANNCKIIHITQITISEVLITGYKLWICHFSSESNAK